MMSIRWTIWKKRDLCGTWDNNTLLDPAVSLLLIILGRDVTHLLVKVGAGGSKISASHRVQHFPEYKLIINQARWCVIQDEELRKMTVCPPHRRKFTRMWEFSGHCQNPLHKGEKAKLKKPNKITADISKIIYQETGIASQKYYKLFLFTDNRSVFYWSRNW